MSDQLKFFTWAYLKSQKVWRVRWLVLIRMFPYSLRQMKTCRLRLHLMQALNAEHAHQLMQPFSRIWISSLHPGQTQQHFLIYPSTFHFTAAHQFPFCLPPLPSKVTSEITPSFFFISKSLTVSGENTSDATSWKSDFLKPTIFWPCQHPCTKPEKPV